MSIYSRFTIVAGSTEKPIVSLTNEAADEALDVLTRGMSQDALEAKLASLAWDCFEHEGATCFVVYIDNA